MVVTFHLSDGTANGFFFFLLVAVCTPHAEYYILFWRGVRGCLNHFSGCYCKKFEVMIKIGIKSSTRDSS